MSEQVQIAPAAEPIPPSPAPPVLQPDAGYLGYDRSLLRPMSLGQKLRAVLKYLWVRLKGGPMSVNMEVTYLCNATCDFCDYWKVKRSGKLGDYDYVEALRKLNPLTVTLTGGEPTINKQLPEAVSRIKDGLGFVYIGMVTHGSLLTVEKVMALWDAGLDHISISLNYIGREHDEERGIDGLYEHISSLVPQLTARGVNVIFNTVIMRENLDHVVPIAHLARSMDAKVSYSCYSDFKNGNETHLVNSGHTERLESVIEDLICQKSRLGNIVNSAWYLRRIPDYFRDALPRSCTAAGKWLVQLTPDGNVKPCAELPVLSGYDDFKRVSKKIDCNRCWYSCRGETESSLKPGRLLEGLVRAWRSRT